MSARRQERLIEGDFALTQADFREIADMLYADARIDMPESKASLVYSRLIKRLRALNLESFSDYCALLRENGGGDGERREMLSGLTTNVTRFFRERHHFEHLASSVLPALLARARRGQRARVWSAGCSSGEEPYSIALTVLQQDPRAVDLDVRVLATDIDPRMIAQGREGLYPEAALAEDVPPVALQRSSGAPATPCGAWWRSSASTSTATGRCAAPSTSSSAATSRSTSTTPRSGRSGANSRGC